MKNQQEVTPTEARQATMRPRAMVWVLFGSLFLCVMAGLGLALGWISLPFLPRQAMHGDDCILNCRYTHHGGIRTPSLQNNS